MRYHDGAVEFAHRIWLAEPAALASIRRETQRWLARLNLLGDAEEDLVLAVNEAASNVIDHEYPESGGGGPIELFFWTEPRALSLEILDHGKWRPLGPHGCGRGRGIDMMRLSGRCRVDPPRWPRHPGGVASSATRPRTTVAGIGARAERPGDLMRRGPTGSDPGPFGLSDPGRVGPRAVVLRAVSSWLCRRGARDG